MHTSRFTQLLIFTLVVGIAVCNVDCGKKDQSSQQQGPEQTAATGTKETSSAPDLFKKYSFKSAIVELKYSGDCSGTETVYIDDYGMKEAIVDNYAMKVMGTEVQTNHIQLNVGEWHYSIDLKKMKATKMKNAMVERMKNMSGEERKKWQGMGEEVLKGMNGKEVGEETVAGKPCKVLSMESVGTKVWIWEGMTLKRHVKIMGVNQELEAVNLQLDVPVPADKFEVPSGVQVTEQDMSKMMEQMKKGADEANPAE
jgi:hypothetical protein